MSQVDLSNLSIDELNALQKNAEQMVKAKQKQEVKNAYVEFQRIATSLGLTVEEIVKAGKGVKNKMPAKYQNPSDASQTWSGQGRKPQWVVDALAAGKSLESLLIK